ncbi:MAG: phosphatidate cytidylyltransferase, partial [bacterium]|nr:phosphatidate cytidylyltransferase [bacterium]
ELVVEPEPKPELVVESEPELVAEPALDEPEPELVVEPEPKPELVVESEPELVAEPALDEPEPELVVEPEPEPELVVESEPVPEPELVAESEPESESESESEPELVVEPEPEPELVVESVPESGVDPVVVASPYEDYSDWLIEPRDSQQSAAAVEESPDVAPEIAAAEIAPKAAAAEPPVTPEPVTSEPVTPEPVTPEPVTPEPVTPEPVTSEPPPLARVEPQEPSVPEGAPAMETSFDPVVVVPPGPSLDLLWSVERAAPALSPTLATLEEQEAATAASLLRIRRQAAELRADAELAAAGAAAHEDARMWAVIADVREDLDKKRAAEIREAASIETEARVSPEVLAEEARRMEAARAGFDEARMRTEAEVRNVLQQEPGGHPGQTLIVEVAESNGGGARFAVMAAQIREIDRAEAERLERREQLNLWTSLLLLDAEQPWDAAGWSRPGNSLSNTASGTESPQLLLTPQGPITTGSPGSVPESVGRRRWPWSKKQATPTAPSAPQDSLRSVVVIEERSVPDQPNDEAPEGQEAFALEDSDVSPPAADLPAAGDVPGDGDIEEELAAWSDLDWDFTEKEDVPAGTPLEKDALVEFDQPDESAASVESSESVDSVDESAEASGHDWEAFTAEEYVQTATHEYADLAAAVAASEAEAPAQAALSADMPGLESSLVSLDDVVEAEGLERADAHPGRSDLALRVITALALVSLFFATLTYRWSIGLLVLVVMSVAAGELTIALVNRHYHPVALFSYLGTAGALIGAWAYGPVAIPVAVAVTLLVVILFFGLVTGRQDPLVSVALTVAVVLWVGVLGAFAYDLIPAPEYRWLIGSFVVIVALMDVAQYFVGKSLGKRPLAPTVSPKKTVAGLVGGVVAAMAVGYGLSFVAPFDATTGVVLGAALAVTGPTGDLAVSVLKRSMGVKDMGTILPGHGGVVDRIDAILFSLPAAWAVYAWAGLLV